MKRTAVVPLMILILITGCFQRESLYELATLSISEIPTVVVADPEGSILSIPTNTLISVLFSLPMDTDSVEKAFHLSYDSTELDETDGNFYWLNNNRLFVFELINSLPQFVEVTAVINFTAQSNEGINLKDAYQWTFTVSDTTYGGSPTAGVISPAFDDVVFPDHTFEINFDRAMLRSTVEASFLLISDDFSDFRTVDEGSFTWSGTTVYYTTNTPLIENKRYFIYFNNNGVVCLDLAGNPLLNFTPVGFYTRDKAIYVSATIGNDLNKGFHPTIPVKSVLEGINKAVGYGFIKIKIAEGMYSDDVYLNNSIYNDLYFQGGWNADFTDFSNDPFTYPAEISPIANNFTFTFIGVSGCTLSGLRIRGKNSPLENNGAVLIDAGSSNITIANSLLVGSDTANYAYGILIRANSNDITIRDCEIYGANPNFVNNAYGVAIQTSNNITIQDCFRITGSSGNTMNTGIETVGTVNNIIIKNNQQIDGGGDGKCRGIYLGNGAKNVFIQNNTYIIGGFLNTGGPRFGIYIGNDALATIRDNQLIHGGYTKEFDSYGIWVENNARVDFYRNIIGGGEDQGNTVVNQTVGLYLNASGTCNVFNNVIVGGSESNDTSNNCYGIFITNSDSVILNNTIDGKGSLGFGNTTGAIYGIKTDSYVINNILIGGEGFASFGIQLNNVNYLINNMLIYNNTFYREKCSTAYLGDTFTNWSTIAAMETNYNIVPNKPKNNLDYDEVPTFSPDIMYIDPVDPFNNYRIDVGISFDLSTIRDNGYNPDNLPIFTPGGAPKAAVLDIDQWERNLNSIDRGAHEFSQ